MSSWKSPSNRNQTSYWVALWGTLDNSFMWKEILELVCGNTLKKKCCGIPLVKESDLLDQVCQDVNCSAGVRVLCPIHLSSFLQVDLIFWWLILMLSSCLQSTNGKVEDSSSTRPENSHTQNLPEQPLKTTPTPGDPTGLQDQNPLI